MKNWTVGVLVILLIIVGAGNLWATHSVVQDSRQQRTEQVCTTFGKLITKIKSPDAETLINAWGQIYGCDWSHP